MVNVGLRGYIWQQKSEKAQIRREARGGTVVAGNAQPEYDSLSKQALCSFGSAMEQGIWRFEHMSGA